MTEQLVVEGYSKILKAQWLNNFKLSELLFHCNFRAFDNSKGSSVSRILPGCIEIRFTFGIFLSIRNYSGNLVDLWRVECLSNG